ncbi:MAG: hypothetical protein ACYC2H_11155 [Thermoplasmatota archaeon]
MKTTTTVALGLMVALLCAAGAAVAEPAQETRQDAACPPVWFEASGEPQVDPDCVQGPLFDNSR